MLSIFAWKNVNKIFFTWKTEKFWKSQAFQCPTNSFISYVRWLFSWLLRILTYNRDLLTHFMVLPWHNWAYFPPNWQLSLECQGLLRCLNYGEDWNICIPVVRYGLTRKCYNAISLLKCVMMSSSLYFDYPEHFLVSYQALPKLMYIILPKKTIHFRLKILRVKVLRKVKH